MELKAAAWIEKNYKLNLLIKDEDGWRYIEPNIKPYFFVRKSDLDILKSFLVEKKINYNISDDVDAVTFLSHEPAVKVEVDFPNQVREIRNSINILTFEADIPFVRRWMIDNDFKASEKPKILFFDVESDARAGMPSPSDPVRIKQRVLSVAAVDEDGNDYFLCDDEESVILEEFFKTAVKYDILAGWNIDMFDVPYLNYHYKSFGLKSPFEFISTLDLMSVYKTLYWVAGSTRLSDIAKQEIGLDKLLNLYEHGGAHELWRWFTEDRRKLYDYNIVDAMLLRKLFIKWNSEAGLKDLIVNTIRKGYTFYDAFLIRSQIIDSLILRKVFEAKPRIVLQNKIKREHIDIPGALTLEPITGIYEYVLVADFASLYPTLILSFNISPETVDLNGDIKTPNLRFKSKPQGILPEILKILVEERVKWKNLLKVYPEGSNEYLKAQAIQASLKTLINSFYGVMAHEGFRLFYPEVASAITLTGQYVMKKTTQIFEKMGFKVLYGDTDSLFIYSQRLKEIFEGKGEKYFKKYCDFLLDEISEELKKIIINETGVSEESYCIKIDIEKVFKKLFLPPVKKRYVAIPLFGIEKYTIKSRDIFSGLTVRGFELVRGDIPPFLKTVELQIFKILMESSNIAEAKNKTIQYLRSIKKALYSGCLDDKLVMRKTMTKRADEYKSLTAHVKAGKELIERGTMRPGDTVQYIIIGEGKNGLNVVPYEENQKISPYYNYYWERALGLVERIWGERIDPSERTLKEWI